jgi:hypothetical protein
MLKWCQFSLLCSHDGVVSHLLNLPDDIFLMDKAHPIYKTALGICLICCALHFTAYFLELFSVCLQNCKLFLKIHKSMSGMTSALYLKQVYLDCAHISSLADYDMLDPPFKKTFLSIFERLVRHFQATSQSHLF